MKLFIAVLPIALAASGCAGYIASYEASSVRGSFVTDQSCPADRVIVGPIARPEATQVEAPPPPAPPAEIAQDPARLAIYNARHGPADPYADAPFFQAQGCGVTHVYACPMVANGDGSVSPVCTAVGT